MATTDTTTTVLILGAPDPEMSAIEKLAREAGVAVCYATDSTGERVSPQTAASAVGAVGDTDDLHRIRARGGMIALVECRPGAGAAACYDLWALGMAPGSESESDCAAVVVSIDHHAPGDPGYGRPPDEFLRGSSIGQLISLLARHGLLASATTDDAGVGCAHVGDMHYVGGRWHVVIGVHDDGDDPGVGRVVAAAIPDEIVLTAAADHCLGAAYRGECPGVDPGALLASRTRTRAAHQGCSEADLRSHIMAARAEIRAATTITIGSAIVHDMRRPEPIPELVEAAMVEGAEYVSGPLTDPRDPGRAKYTVSGRPETVRAWMDIWAPAQGIAGIYGDPARGFAGGYLRAS